MFWFFNKTFEYYLRFLFFQNLKFWIWNFETRCIKEYKFGYESRKKHLKNCLKNAGKGEYWLYLCDSWKPLNLSAEIINSNFLIKWRLNIPATPPPTPLSKSLKVNNENLKTKCFHPVLRLKCYTIQEQLILAPCVQDLG